MAGVPDAVDHFVAACVGQCDRRHGLAARRQLVDDRRVQVGIRRHSQCAGDGCCGHDELVRIAFLGHPFLPQGDALMHAEAVLLVDDHEREPGEVDALLEQGVRADDDLRAAVGNGRQCLAARRATLAATQPGGVYAQRPEPVAEAAPVLFGQQFGRRHYGGLHAAGDCPQAGNGRDDGLAGAHVALDQAHHRMLGGEVVEDLVDDALLRARQLERQPCNKSSHRTVVVP